MRGDDAAVVITEYRDGPLLVRGNFQLLDADGQEILTTRKTVPLRPFQPETVVRQLT